MTDEGQRLLQELRTLPTTFDLIIGDFGREAATRYVRLLAEEERALLMQLLASLDLPFLDEYRRIMVGHVGDVAFVKQHMIDQVWSDAGHLNDDVLVAVRNHAVPDEIVARFACLIHDEAVLARRRGHSLVRVVLPCNALSEVLELAVAMARDVATVGAAAASIGYDLLSGLPIPQITSHGVVRSALAELERERNVSSAPFVVLGAAMARRQYEELGETYGMRTVWLNDRAQEVVDDAVLACISGDASTIARVREELERLIITPLRRRYPGLTTIEACTDFDFGIGLDSVRLLARHMVYECYAGLHGSCTHGASLECSVCNVGISREVPSAL